MNITQLKEEELLKAWFTTGENYAKAINEMVEFCEKNGWENWKGEEPDDNREYLAKNVFEKLKAANKNKTVSTFRKAFPPAHAPFIEMIKNKSQEIKHLNYIGNNSVIFNVEADGATKTYLLKTEKVTQLSITIEAVGKSKENNFFAVKVNDAIVITEEFQGN
ncbi:MAG TPA: hypothetical protein VJ970_04105, partial [Flavobacteriaceae bacterium]|nr:hypothetical protein [Flavobacteriaceae bacterium]